MSDVLLFVDTVYGPEPGQFGRIKSITNGRYEIAQWHRCREMWHYKLKTLNLFFFAHPVGKTRAIVEFMTKVEQILGVMPRSQYGPTQRKNICWVKPSLWWLKCGMRRSLYTIILRTAQFYKIEEDNFEEALFTHKYMQATALAVRRFFAGYTVYTARRRGWVRQFTGLSTQEIEHLLIRKDI